MTITKACWTAFIAFSIAVVVLLAGADSAGGATTLANPEELADPGWYERQLARAQVPTPDLAVRIEERRCREARAEICAFPSKLLIVMPWDGWLWTAEYRDDPIYDYSRRLDRAGFMHELGHIWDFAVKRTRAETRSYRRLLAQVLGYRASRWKRWDWRLFEPAADAYAHCALWPERRRTPPGGNEYGLYKPSLEQHRAVCRRIARAA